MGGIKQRHLSREEEGRRATTLGDLERQRVAVFCWCNRCGHSASIEPGRLAAELGRHYAVPAVGGRLRCSGCHSKDVATRPAWPSLGQVTRHD